MKVRLLLFAHYRDLAGHDELEFELPPGSTAFQLVERLRADPRLQSLPATPAIAVNHTYASLSVSLAEGDEVALIPPVAGG
ncbi:MAG: MoaD/ThiS family protein [Gemmatimonadota bacterium]